MAMSNNTILKIIFIIWVIFSVAYIGWDIWSDFKLRELSQAYQQGRVDTINVLIEQAKQCDPIPVVSGDKQIQVINVNCLQNQTP